MTPCFVNDTEKGAKQMELKQVTAPMILSTDKIFFDPAPQQGCGALRSSGRANGAAV